MQLLVAHCQHLGVVDTRIQWVLCPLGFGLNMPYRHLNPYPLCLCPLWPCHAVAPPLLSAVLCPVLCCSFSQTCSCTAATKTEYLRPLEFEEAIQQQARLSYRAQQCLKCVGCVCCGLSWSGNNKSRQFSTYYSYSLALKPVTGGWVLSLKRYNARSLGVFQAPRSKFGLHDCHLIKHTGSRLHPSNEP